MNPENPRPEWACSQWNNAGHDWLECTDCMEAYDMMIEKAQDGWEEDSAETKAVSSD